MRKNEQFWRWTEKSGSLNVKMKNVTKAKGERVKIKFGPSGLCVAEMANVVEDQESDDDDDDSGTWKYEEGVS